MGITRFIILLLLISISVLFYQKEFKANYKLESTKKPLISFDDSLIYEISSKGVAKILQLDSVNIFEEFQEINNVTILFKKDGEDIDNTLNANFAKKDGDDIFLSGDVDLQRGDNFNLRTEDLQYNIKSQILKTNKKFILTIDDNQFEGVGLFIDARINKIVTDNIHFKLRLKDTNDTK